MSGIFIRFAPMRWINRILFPATFFILLGACRPKEPSSHTVAPPAKAVDTSVTPRYGIAGEGLLYFDDTIGANDYLGAILSRYGVSSVKIQQIAEAADTVFNVRRFRMGTPYCVIARADSIPAWFVYEIDAVNYVVYDFSKPDTVKVYRGRKPVRTITREVTGTIENSLWVSMEKAGASPLLALHLADIYAWTIDFYHLQKGDAFKAIYEEQYAGDKKVGVSRVLAACMIHMGEPYYAILFEKDSISDYFDTSGHSMRKAFLKAPLKFSRITSRYSTSRYHPILHRRKAHLGTDFAAPYGTSILATGDGVVIKKGYTSGNGRYIKIRHNSVYSTQYLHMSRFASGIHVGSKVKQGDVIGYVGSSGLATGPHVCYRFWKNGRQVDPFREKLPPSKPLPGAYRNDFRVLCDSILNRLNQLTENAFFPSGTMTKVTLHE